MSELRPTTISGGEERALFLRAVRRALPAYFQRGRELAGSSKTNDGALLVFCEEIIDRLVLDGQESLALLASSNRTFLDRYMREIKSDRTVGGRGDQLARYHDLFADAATAEPLVGTRWAFRLQWHKNRPGSRGRVGLEVEPFTVAASSPQPELGKRQLRQLPAPLLEFTPRVPKSDELLAALRKTPTIVEVVGPPGAGKSELAIVVSHERALAEVFPDGAIYVDLAPPTTTGMAMRAVIAVLRNEDVALPADPMLLQGQYREALSEKRILLLFDNVPTNASVRPLRPSAGATILITAQRRSMLPGAVTVPVDPMRPDEARAMLRAALPWLADVGIDVWGLMSSQAPWLYERFDNEEYRDLPGRYEIADVLAVLADRLPAALGVVVQTLQRQYDASNPQPDRVIQEYLAKVLTSPGRLRRLAAPDAPNAAISTFEAAYEALTSSLQQALRRLSVFPASFNSAMATAITSVPAKELQQLVERSLLKMTHADTRYKCADLIRSFAWDLLEGSADYEEVRTAHALYFGAIAERVWRELQERYVDQEALGKLMEEWPDVVAALAWANDRRESPPLANALVALVATVPQGEFGVNDPVRPSTLVPFLDHAIEVLKTAGDASLLDTMQEVVAVHVYREAQQYAKARECALAHISYARASGDSYRLARAIEETRRSGLLPLNIDEAIALLEELIAAQTDYPSLDAMNSLVDLCATAGRSADAWQWIGRVEQQLRARTDTSGVVDQEHLAGAVFARGELLLLSGAYDDAVDAFKSFLGIHAAIESATKSSLNINAHARLASLATRRGDLDTARAHMLEALQATRQHPLDKRRRLPGRLATARAYADLCKPRATRRILRDWAWAPYENPTFGVGEARLLLGLAALQEGDYQEAVRWYHDARPIFDRDLKARPGAAESVAATESIETYFELNPLPVRRRW